MSELGTYTRLTKDDIIRLDPLFVENTILNEKVKNLQSALSKTRKRRTAKDNEVLQMATRIGDLKQRNEQLKFELKTATKEINKLTHHINQFLAKADSNRSMQIRFAEELLILRHALTKPVRP